jgi:hypothetical protein
MHQFFQTTVGVAQTRWAQRALLAPLIGLLMLIVSAVPVRAQTLTFTAVLNSGQEPPPNTNDSQAFGVQPSPKFPLHLWLAKPTLSRSASTVASIRYNAR